MDIFVLGAVAVLSAMAGFGAGRSLNWNNSLREGSNLEEDEGIAPIPKNIRALSKHWEVSSPVTGDFDVMEEQGKKLVRIRPLQGKVYAPASGKITKLFPMGRAMIMQTEFGAEISIQVGDKADEMWSELYRCRVMENEVIRKGTLVLEYDMERIEAAGGGSDVTLSVENEEALGPFSKSSSNHVKVGEPILYVACDIRSVSYDKQP